MSQRTKNKHRLSTGLPLAVLGAAASVVLALGFSPTISAFVASITDSTNSVATGYVEMTETGPGTTPSTCTSDGTAAASLNTNSATCTTINAYGGTGTAQLLTPGGSTTTTVTVSNTGNVKASAFTLAAGACNQTQLTPSASGGNGLLCGDMTVGISWTAPYTTGTTAPSVTAANTLAPQSLSSFASNSNGINLPAAPAGDSVQFTFTVTLPSSVPNQNTLQGYSVTQPLTWTFNA